MQSQLDLSERLHSDLNESLLVCEQDIVRLSEKLKFSEEELADVRARSEQRQLDIRETIINHEENVDRLNEVRSIH